MQVWLSFDFLSLQVLAGDMTEANREACAEATKPLIDSVESLTAYALSPEFAPLPAKISEEVGAGICSIPVKALWSHRKVMRNLNRLKIVKFFFLYFMHLANTLQKNCQALKSHILWKKELILMYTFARLLDGFVHGNVSNAWRAAITTLSPRKAAGKAVSQFVDFTSSF